MCHSFPFCFYFYFIFTTFAAVVVDVVAAVAAAAVNNISLCFSFFVWLHLSVCQTLFFHFNTKIKCMSNYYFYYGIKMHNLYSTHINATCATVRPVVVLFWKIPLHPNEILLLFSLIRFTFSLPFSSSVCVSLCVVVQYACARMLSMCGFYSNKTFVN